MSTTMSGDERTRFLQALKENPEFRDEVRRQLLSDELLELPDKFARFTEHVNQFMTRTEQFMADQQALNADQQAINARFEQFMTRTEQFMADQQALNVRFEQFMTRTEQFMADQQALNADQQAINARFEQFMTRTEQFMTEQQALNARFEQFMTRTEQFMADQQALNARFEQFMTRTENRMNRMEDNIGILKGNAARRLLRDHLELVLELTGTDFVRILSKNDLLHLARNSGEADAIPYGERRSFYAADLVIEVIDPQGNTCYVTGEASYTADNRDSRRAIRNAEFMKRFTGHPAHPLVASVSNDHEVQDLVDRGALLWFQLDERELESD